MPDMKEYKSAMNGITASDAFKERTERKMREIRDSEPVRKAPKITMKTGRVAPLAALAACAAIVVVLHTRLNDNALYSNSSTEKSADMAVTVSVTEALDVMEDAAIQEEEDSDDIAEMDEIDGFGNDYREEGISQEPAVTTVLAEETVAVETVPYNSEDAVNSAPNLKSPTQNAKGSKVVNTVTSAPAETQAAEQTTQAQAEQNADVPEVIEDTPIYDFEKDDVDDVEDDEVYAEEADEEESLDFYTIYDGELADSLFANTVPSSGAATYGADSVKPRAIIERDNRNVTPQMIYNDYLGGDVTVISTASGLPQTLDPVTADELIRELTDIGEPVRKDHITPSDSLYIVDLFNGDSYLRAYVSTVTVTFRVPGGSGDMYVTYELSEFPSIFSQIN